MDENNQMFMCLLQNHLFTEAEKNRIKKSKQAFDTGYFQACKQFKDQVATFDAQFVLLDWSSGTSYDDDKFLPRSFTLYTLVQRHLLQKKIQKNKIWWSYHYRMCNTFWSPMSTLVSIYQSVQGKFIENKISTTQELLTEIHMAILNPGTVEKDLAYLQHVYPSLPPVLVKRSFLFFSLF